MVIDSSKLAITLLLCKTKGKSADGISADELEEQGNVARTAD